ncbi:MAG: HEAT repeat domain-containing protein [Planctomycetota bacterium]|nr:HEAT repeat domain-containing protein [Planctomycetota bacterium]
MSKQELRTSMLPYVLFVLFVLFVLCIVNRSVGAEPAQLRWLSDVNVAYREALARQQPILVRAGGESCPWCKALDAEIAKPEVQQGLAAWTLVSIDVDKSPGDALRLNVSGIPALRALTPRGRIVAAQDGFLEAEELLAWMKESHEAATSTADDVLFSDHEPSLLEVVRIVRLFNERDAELREAAIRRLLPFPKTAASAVVNTLREGSLASRLVAYELLNEWRGPLGEFDPWRPESLTDEQLAAVEAWLTNIDAFPPPGAAKKLTEDELQTARNDISLMLKADRSEAAAVRERIARLGRGVLPEVLARLNDAATDEDRERLVTLRYRLAAADGLALAWPGGLERLADRDPAVRHLAAEELAAMATADEQTLLLELFSDLDPLVREISLRGLRNVGGEQATAALVTLLNDPEPNVRAAVLKQLAEDKSTEMLNQVAEYVKQEPDADLVVHAIRYFREASGSQAVPTLLSLLEHDSWQVRAEAAEAIGKTLETAHYHRSGGGEYTTESYDALLKLLADQDAFVVSRALEGLSDLNAKRAVEPLVHAAAAHPTLASQIVDLLAGGSEMREAAVPHLRAFFASDDPAVRAAAIRGLCKTDPRNVKDDLLAAVRDEHTLVRTSAATSLLEMIDDSRPASDGAGVLSRSVHFDVSPNVGNVTLFDKVLSGLFGGSEPAVAVEPTDKKDEDKPTEPESNETSKPADSETDAEPEAEEDIANPLNAWLAERYSGKLQFEWMSELREPLREMLAAEETDERLTAALVLLPFGDADLAMPVLLAMVTETPSLLPQVGEALRWLVWEQRIEVYGKLDAVARNETERSSLVYAMSKIPEFRATELYWQALNHPDATKSLAEWVQRALKEAYFGDSYYDVSSITTRVRKRAVASVTPQLQDGPALKRLVAIDLLLEIAPDDALASAQQLMTDASVDAALRSDAFQITLAAQTNTQRTATAIESLAGSDAHRRAVALKFLAIGPTSLAQLPATGFTIKFEDDGTYRYYASGQPIIPEPPRRLVAEHVSPLINDADPQLAAHAGYLLTMFHNAAGIEPLLRYWRAEDASDELDRLVYRAIAVLDDPRHIPVLKQIYARLEESDKPEFYWTIRIMSGPEILAFRKQIREEVGMSNLK